MKLDLCESTWKNLKNNVEFKKQAAKSYIYYETIHTKTMVNIDYGYWHMK